MRCRLTELTALGARVVTDDGRELTVEVAGSVFEGLSKWARKGDEWEVTGGTVHRGVWRPMLVVADPDWLVDVTSLSGCWKDYGFHGLNSLIERFKQRTTTWQIELGYMTNEFLECCIEEHAPDYARAVANAFRARVLALCATDGIDAGFFRDARQQFENIRAIVKETLPGIGVAVDQTAIETLFVVHELGMQGRLDALCGNTVIELKSGKADEFHGGKAKGEHRLQIMMYEEMVRMKMPTLDKDKAIKGMLVYSRYPKLMGESYAPTDVQRAMAVRNEMVAIERLIREGGLEKLVERLQASDFNTHGENGKLWTCYQRPVVERFLSTVNGLQGVERAYFHRFVQFLAREHEIGKRTMARIWREPIERLEEEGEAVAGLTIETVMDSDGCVVELRCTTPRDLSGTNFRRGDMLMLCEEGMHGPTFRCQLMGIGPHTLHLALPHKVRNAALFERERPMMVATGYTEALYTQACRGMVELMNADRQRRELLMGIQPGTATEQRRDGVPEDFDYFLLVGPPGTGKTNVHLRRMVRRFMADGERVLVTAFTNQAVDEICGVLEEECGDSYARIGNEGGCAGIYHRRLMRNVTAGCRTRNEVMQVLGRLRVVCGTIASLSAHDELFRLMTFGTTIVDEASQVLESQLLPMLTRVGRFVLIGDHKQLPAVVAQDRTESEVTDERLRAIGLTNCADSYFERLYNLQLRWGVAHLTTATLTRQGRMHEELMAFVNRHFYGGILQTAGLPHQSAPTTGPHRRLRFIDSDCGIDCSMASVASKSNAHEAEIVARVVEEIEGLYEQSGRKVVGAKTIGVIVPFRAQIATVRNAIRNRRLAEEMTIDTVERYQGSQRDVIIYNTVVTQGWQMDTLCAPVIMADGTEVDRKLNVALTRARERLIIVGSRRTLMQSRLYGELVQFIDC